MLKIILLLIVTISCSSPPVSLVYIGQRTEDNIYNGYGELTFPDGSNWNGEFVNGKANRFNQEAEKGRDPTEKWKRKRFNQEVERNKKDSTNKWKTKGFNQSMGKRLNQ